MNRSLPLLFSLLVAGSLYAQTRTVPSRYGSPTGFGSVLYPGTGQAPQPAPVGVIGRGGAQGRGGIIGGAPRYAHPNHSRRLIVPVPVFVGGYGYGYGYDVMAPGPAYSEPGPQPVTPPVVIINQAYRPEVANPIVREYTDLPEPPVRREPEPRRPRSSIDDEKATIYLIAFQDHTILPALAYWVDGDTLVYITEQGMPNRASLALIDKEFSKRLNRERNVDFNLP